MDYDEFYAEQGGFKAANRDWLIENTDLPEGRGRLLDAGCGDGEWSILLSEWYNVTGIDLSEKGVEVARKRAEEAGLGDDRVAFRAGSALDLGDETWDVIFCRAPSFLNLPSDDPVFLKNVKTLLRHCPGGKLVYIKYSKPPYERWVESNYFRGFDSDPELAPDSKWYYNDPELIKGNLAGIGEVEITNCNFYFALTIKSLS